MAFMPILLPNGTTLKNRIAKAAMEENMADIEDNFSPSMETLKLYSAWGQGGCGLIISGNVMIDPRAMTGPAGIVLSNHCHGSEARIREWITQAQSGGAQFFLQVNHPGRQMKIDMGQQTIAPSAKSVEIGSLTKMLFAVPRAMTPEDIQDIIDRFAETAVLAERYGASGIQIHAAHGYLLSQFLSPLSNQRTDQWGGSLENRSRLLFEVIRQVRSRVAKQFGVAVKINSADFQRGGFAPEEASWIVSQLNDMSIDFVEISGGSIESPVMAGPDNAASSSLAREAYFLEFGRQIGKEAKMPIMITGGIYRREIVDKVVSDGKTIAGMGTALSIVPDLPKRWQNGEDPCPRNAHSWVLSGPLLGQSRLSQVVYQLDKLASGQQTYPGVWPVFALVRGQLRTSRNVKRYRAIADSTSNFETLLQSA